MFLLQTIEHGQTPPFHYLPCGNIAPKAGMAMTFSGGVLIACTGTGKPEYISVMENEESQTGKVIPVMRVTDNLLYATTANASMAAITIGDKVTISADGMKVTNTPSGAAQVIAMDGKNAGSKITVRFV